MTDGHSDGVAILIVAARFLMGRVVATPGALDAISHAGQVPEELLGRHCTCDWGDLSESDHAQNNFALTAGERLFSAYHLTDSTKVWVITEWDRSVTTILLPEEY